MKTIITLFSLLVCSTLMGQKAFQVQPELSDTVFIYGDTEEVKNIIESVDSNSTKNVYIFYEKNVTDSTKKDVCKSDTTFISYGNNHILIYIDKNDQKNDEVEEIINQVADDEIEEHGKKKKKFNSHFCGFYYGFVNTTGNDYGNYSESEDGFMDMDWNGSFMMSFNMFDKAISLNRNGSIKAVTGLGLDYYRFRLSDDNISIKKVDGKIMPYSLSDAGYTNIRRSTFKSLYLTIPVLAEFNFGNNSDNFWISAGIINGFRVHSKTKIVYENEDGDKCRKKKSGSYNMIPYKGDVQLKFGFNDFCIWGNYTFTSMFERNKGPKMSPYAIGVGLTFE